MLFFLLLTSLTYGQQNFSVNGDVSDHDFRILIGSNLSSPDLKIRFGNSVPFEDFTVGMTNFRSDAHFILTNDEDEIDCTILAGAIVSDPDLRLEVSSDISFPDLTIQFQDHGFPDYLIYSEIDNPTDTQILMTLLPLIHKKTNYQFDQITEILLEHQEDNNFVSCEELSLFLKKRGSQEGPHLTKTNLQSVWLRSFQAYKYNHDYYAIAELKGENDDEDEIIFQVYKIRYDELRNFLDDDNDFVYEERFRTHIYDNSCGCK